MPKEEEKFLETSEIFLKLNTYDDIFSSFDSRPYSEKSLSQDFLEEAKRASIDKVGEIELNFQIPKEKKSLVKETLIKKRLRNHFKKHFEIVKKEKKGIVLQGLSFTISGILIMLLATLIFFKYQDKTFFYAFLVVFLEPAGWFLFWEGLNLVIFEAKTKKPDLSFYEKMSQCVIVFSSY